jgi:hypothetical protein
MLFTGNWDAQPMIYSRFLAWLRRRRGSKVERKKGDPD